PSYRAIIFWWKNGSWVLDFILTTRYTGCRVSVKFGGGIFWCSMYRRRTAFSRVSVIWIIITGKIVRRPRPDFLRNGTVFSLCRYRDARHLSNESWACRVMKWNLITTPS